MAVRVMPYTPLRLLAKELKTQPSQLMRRLGWRKARKRFTLDVLADEASEMWPCGRYVISKLSDCIVPSEIAGALLSSHGKKWFRGDPNPRAPPRLRPSQTGVVVVLAHVDHGKTTLLDALLGTSVVESEAGRITQCVRPSFLSLPWRQGKAQPLRDAMGLTDAPEAGTSTDGEEAIHTVAFIDTPGHQAFCNMREVAAEGADFALVLVAADAGVQPQTVEVVRRCREKQLPLLFVVTKADLLAASYEEAHKHPRLLHLQKQLMALFCNSHESSVPAAMPQLKLVSAAKGWGLAGLVETIVTQLATGTPESDRIPHDCGSAAVVVETSREKGVGTALTAVIRTGQLAKNDWFSVGQACGKVRQLWRLQCGTTCPTDVGHTGWSVRVSVAWAQEKEIDTHFEVGDVLHVMPRLDAIGLARYRALTNRFFQMREPLEPCGSHESTSEAIPRVAAVIKSQSAGELQAMIDFLTPRALDTEQVHLIGYGVGSLRDHELMLAHSAHSQGVPCDVYLLNVTASKPHRELAQKQGTTIREYAIFHDLLSDLLRAAGLEEPVRELADMSDDGAPKDGTSLLEAGHH